MADIFFLAWRYLRAHLGQALVLTAGLGTALFLPLMTALSTELLERELHQRADDSPLLVGHAGSEFDLTFASLYFRGSVNKTIPFGLRHQLAERRSLAIPLHVGHSASGAPVVGTSPEYYRERRLRAADGRLPVQLGEVVAGAGLAKRHGFQVGDTLRSDLQNLYNLAGAYPLLLRVVGVLEPSDGPDDGVFFTGLETSWALDGLFHGHQAVTAELSVNPEAPDEESIEASAAIFIITELTDANRASFHLHGDPDEAPVSAFLAFPADQRAHDQVLGDLSLDELHQAVRPRQVVSAVLNVVLRLRLVLDAYTALVTVTTLAFFALVALLALRLRRQELELMIRIGASRSRIAAILCAQILIVTAAASMIAVASSVLGLWLLKSALHT